MDHQMIAEMLGNYGEFVGAIAVVATLVYLAVQVKHNRESMDKNTRLVRADMERQFVQQWDQVNYQLSESRDIASLMRRGNEDFDSLDDDERTIFFFRLSNRIDFYYAAMRLARDGFIGEEYASSVAATIPLILSERGSLAVWEEIGSSYPASFQQHVNSRLSSQG